MITVIIVKIMVSIEYGVLYFLTYYKLLNSSKI